MFSTYEEYLAMPGSLTFEEMASLHRQILEEAGRDADALVLYGELYAAAVKYAQSRAHWPLWDREEKQEEDRTRTSRHDHVIDSFNILARYLKKQGKDVSWHDTLGSDRKRIGDLACYLVFTGSLNAR